MLKKVKQWSNVKKFWFIWTILMLIIVGKTIYQNVGDFDVKAFDEDIDNNYLSIKLSNKNDTYLINGSENLYFDEKENYGDDFYYHTNEDDEILTIFLFSKDDYKEMNATSKDIEESNLSYSSFENYSIPLGDVLLYTTNYDNSQNPNVVESWIFVDNSIINISYYFSKEENIAINDVKNIINNIEKI